jgi:hypothetical protein
MISKRLKIGDLEVPEHLIQYVVFSTGSVPVSFSIVATEEDGKKMEERLKQLESQRALAFCAIAQGTELSGRCNILNLKVEADSSEANLTECTPVLYRIQGQLEPVS